MDLERFVEIYGNPPELPALYFISSNGQILNRLMGVQDAAVVMDTVGIAQAKNKIERIRLEKEAAAKLASETAEIKRREDAKLLQESKKQMEDRRRAMEAARAREESEKSRRHRDEVVEKVRAEREERKRKEDLSRSGGDAGVAPAQEPLPRPALSTSRGSAPSPSSNGRAKIKFVVGDSHISHEFDARDSLLDVRDFLRDQGYANFSLETVYPRRTLTSEQDQLSLADLNLTPACAIVVNLTPSASLRGVGGRIAAAVSAAGGNRAQDAPAAAPVAASQPTIHPNIDSTYIHPVDTNTFFNDCWNGVLWIKSKLTGCRRPRRALEEASPQAVARSRRGPYEQLDTDEF